MTSCKPFPALDYSSTDALVRANMRLVRSIAARIHRQFVDTIEFDDLLTLGVEGLLQAAYRFTGDKGAQFTTFAFLRIRGQILDGIPGLLPVRRHLEAADAHLTEDVAQLMTLRLAPPIAEDLHDATQVSAIEHLLRAELRSELALAVDDLADREKHLLERCYFDGEQLTVAAQERGISKSWASRLQNQTLATLQRQLRAAA